MSGVSLFKSLIHNTNNDRAEKQLFDLAPESGSRANNQAPASNVRDSYSQNSSEHKSFSDLLNGKLAAQSK